MAIDQIKINGVTQFINAKYAQHALSLSSDEGDAVFESQTIGGAPQKSFHITDSEGFDKAVLAWHDYDGNLGSYCKGLNLYEDASDESTNHAHIELGFWDHAAGLVLYDESRKATEILSTKIKMPNHLTLQAEPTSINDYHSRLEIHSGNNTIPGYTKIILRSNTGTYGTQNPGFFFTDKGFLLNRDIWIKDANSDGAGDSYYNKLVLNTGAQTLTDAQKTQVKTNIGVPTKISDLTNDSNFLVNNADISMADYAATFKSLKAGNVLIGQEAQIRGYSILAETQGTNFKIGAQTTGKEIRLELNPGEGPQLYYQNGRGRGLIINSDVEVTSTSTTNTKYKISADTLYLNNNPFLHAGAQTLTDAQKTQARSNIDAAAGNHTHNQYAEVVSFSGGNLILKINN